MKSNFQKKVEIRFAGAGGQGLQTAATIIGESLIRSTDKYVCQSQNYGPESRGGLSYADLIISDEEIDFPKIKTPHILICMSNESFLKFRSEIGKGTIPHLLIDPDMVALRIPETAKKKINIYSISATLISEEIIGNRIGSNIVLVGALNAIFNICSPQEIESTLAQKWPELKEENCAAFRRGMHLGKERNNHG